MNPSVKSEANLFIASKSKQACMHQNLWSVVIYTYIHIWELRWNEIGIWKQCTQIIWSTGKVEATKWKFHSIRDVFENGASFAQIGAGRGSIGDVKPNYSIQQRFPVVDAKWLRSLTTSSGALRCKSNSKCGWSHIICISYPILWNSILILLIFVFFLNMHYYICFIK